MYWCIRGSKSEFRDEEEDDEGNGAHDTEIRLDVGLPGMLNSRRLHKFWIMFFQTMKAFRTSRFYLVSLMAHLGIYTHYQRVECVLISNV